MKKILFLILSVNLFFACNSSEEHKESNKGITDVSIEAEDESYQMSTDGNAVATEYKEDNDVVYSAGSSFGIVSAADASTSVISSPKVKKKNVKPRKMIWKANAKFQVKDVDASTINIKEVIKRHNGFVSKMDRTSSSYEISNRIEIRVANSSFDDLLKELEKESVFVDEMKIYSTDVTEEFIDIHSRLKTKKEVRERYIEVLRNKAEKVKDILAAEEAIRVITEEIEAKEGRLRYLNDKISYSTITLEMYQEVEFKYAPEVYEKPYSNKFTEGLSNGWSIITYFVLFLANIWPLLLLIGLLVWKGKWLLNKLSKKK